MKILFGPAALDQLAEPEERRDVRDARRLLHVVRHDDDRVPRLQLVDQLLDALRGDRIERRRRLVHQEDLGLDRQRPGDAQPLLLAARERQRRGVQPVADLVPERRRLQAGLDPAAQVVARRRQAVDAQAVGDVLEDRLRERVRLLEHHADAPPQGDDVDARRVDVLAVDEDRAFDPGARDDVVHPVQRPEERGLAAARRADERRHLVRMNLEVDALEDPVERRNRSSCP